MHVVSCDGVRGHAGTLAARWFHSHSAAESKKQHKCSLACYPFVKSSLFFVLVSWAVERQPTKLEPTNTQLQNHLYNWGWTSHTLTSSSTDSSAVEQVSLLNSSLSSHSSSANCMTSFVGRYPLYPAPSRVCDRLRLSMYTHGQRGVCSPPP